MQRSWAAFFFFLVVCASSFSQDSAAKIERIEIRGNLRIPETIIRSYIQTIPGDPYEEKRLEADLQSVYKSKLFENISIETEDGKAGKIVILKLQEKPAMRSIAYTGNQSFTESDIVESLKKKKENLIANCSYSRSEIKAAERTLKDLMVQKGVPLGTVRTEIEDLSPSEVRVRFVMNEGNRISIGKIRFDGNKIFSDSELRDALKLTKEHKPGTPINDTNFYIKNKFEYDIAANLKGFYQEHGYMTIQVGEPIIHLVEGPQDASSERQYSIEIPVDAGNQFRIEKLELHNCGVLDCTVLLQSFGLNKGDVVNFKKIKDTIEGIKKQYAELGFADFSYIPEAKFDTRAKTYSLIINFVTGTSKPVSKPVAPAAATNDFEDDDIQMQLRCITTENDSAGSAVLLEQFIRDHPDYPKLDKVYSLLLRTLSENERALVFADELLKRFPSPQAAGHYNAYAIKFNSLRTRENPKEIHELAQKILRKEIMPEILLLAANADPSNELKLIEKAIAERRKNQPMEFVNFSLEDLQMSYAESLLRNEQQEKAIKLVMDLVNTDKDKIPGIKPLSTESPCNSKLDVGVAGGISRRLQKAAKIFSDAGKYLQAIDSLTFSKQAASKELLLDRQQKSSELDLLQAAIYEKIGKPDLQMESYLRAFAARMKPETAERIRELARKTGMDSDNIFERARALRVENAGFIKEFLLKRYDSSSLSLNSLKSRVVLITIFDPTIDISNKMIVFYRRLFEKYKDKGFSWMQIQTQTEEWRFRKRHSPNQITTPVLLADKRGNACYVAGAVSDPTSLVLNAEGKVIFRHMGYQPGTMEIEIRELFGLNPFEDLESVE
jgi:hypothetical protein